LPSFAAISFTRFCCGLFLNHSIRFDLIALTVDVRDGSQFADVRHDDLLAGPGVTTPKVKNRTFRFVAETYRQPKAKCNTFLQRKLRGFSLRFLVVRKRSFVHEAAKHFYNKPVTQQLELINQSGSMQSDSERQGTSK